MLLVQQLQAWDLGFALGGSQNCGPLLGPLNTRCRTIVGAKTRDHTFDNHPFGPWLLVFREYTGILWEFPKNRGLVHGLFYKGNMQELFWGGSGALFGSPYDKDRSLLGSTFPRFGSGLYMSCTQNCGE